MIPTTSSFKNFAITTAVLLCTAIHAQQRSLLWEWPNLACQTTLSCDVGCSACDLPVGNDAVLIGTDGAYVGVSTCPRPFVAGDNAIFSEGWASTVKEDRMVIYSAVTLAPMSLDSILIRHRSWDGGPQFIKISVALGLNGQYSEVFNGPINEEFTWLTLVDLGEVLQQPGYDQWGFQIKFQAYGGSSDGAWVLDEMKVVATDLPPIMTAVPELKERSSARITDPVDLLGRSTGNGSRAGAYIDRQRRIVVVQ